MMPPDPIARPMREDDDVLENDRERDGDGAEGGQRVEARERRSERGRDREPDEHEAEQPQKPTLVEQPRPARLENLSNHRIRRIMNGTAFAVVSAPSSRRCHRFGSQIARRPSTICAARSTVMASNTWVMPPVGSGSAGTNIKNRIVTAKLFSREHVTERAQGLGLLALSQFSSWSLNAVSVLIEFGFRPATRPPPRGRRRATAGMRR